MLGLALLPAPTAWPVISSASSVTKGGTDAAGQIISWLTALNTDYPTGVHAQFEPNASYGYAEQILLSGLTNIDIDLNGATFTNLDTTVGIPCWNNTGTVNVFFTNSAASNATIQGPSTFTGGGASGENGAAFYWAGARDSRVDPGISIVGCTGDAFSLENTGTNTGHSQNLAICGTTTTDVGRMWFTVNDCVGARSRDNTLQGTGSELPNAANGCCNVCYDFESNDGNGIEQIDSLNDVILGRPVVSFASFGGETVVGAGIGPAIWRNPQMSQAPYDSGNSAISFAATAPQINNVSSTGTAATITLNSAHTFVVGQVITITDMQVNTALNGTWTLTGVTTLTATFGFVHSAITSQADAGYVNAAQNAAIQVVGGTIRTNNAPILRCAPTLYLVSNVTGNGTTCTITSDTTTGGTNLFSVGSFITIVGSSNASLNSSWHITAVGGVNGAWTASFASAITSGTGGDLYGGLPFIGAANLTVTGVNLHWGGSYVMEAMNSLNVQVVSNASFTPSDTPGSYPALDYGGNTNCSGIVGGPAIS